MAAQFQATEILMYIGGGLLGAILLAIKQAKGIVEEALALSALAALVSVYALWWGRAFAIPLLLGIVISYTLFPLAAWPRLSWKKRQLRVPVADFLAHLVPRR
jgi:hypothetical protein